MMDISNKQIAELGDYAESLCNCQLIATFDKENLFEETRLLIQKIGKETKRKQLEFLSEQFFLLVVGPVKSGKSTLVNLFSNCEVSPTDFLECTVRPSIITQGPACKITQYKLKDKAINKENDKAREAFDMIVDNVRGFDIGDDLYELVEKPAIADLTEKNLKSMVKLDLSKVKEDDTLLTVISTKGGNLLNGKIVIIDMPGLDGASANMQNDPLYMAVAERADFIVFVQSSTSAITKVSNDFLEIVSKNSNSVPVLLLHNIFDAAHWRSPKEKKEVIDAQMEIAEDNLRQRGFAVESSYAINLGMVNDAGKYNHEGLSTEKEKFQEFENQILQTINLKREKIHYNNCVTKLKSKVGLGSNTDKGHLLSQIRQEVYAYQERVKEIKEEITQIENTIEKIKQLDYCPSGKLLFIHEFVKQAIENERTLTQESIQGSLSNLIHSIPAKIKPKALINLMQSFATRCSDICREQIDIIYKTSIHSRFNKVIGEIEEDISFSIKYLTENIDYQVQPSIFIFNSYKNDIDSGFIKQFINKDRATACEQLNYNYNRYMGGDDIPVNSSDFNQYYIPATVSYYLEQYKLYAENRKIELLSRLNKQVEKINWDRKNELEKLNAGIRILNQIEEKLISIVSTFKETV